MIVATPEAYQLLHQGAITLAKVESNGIRIDTDYLDNAIRDTSEKIKELETRLRADEVWRHWRKRHGQKANLDSLPQLTEVLFGTMKVPYPGGDTRTATGRYRADDEVLTKVDLPFVRDYLRLGDLKKVKSTYLQGIRREVIDGYLHPFFNLNTAVTFRSSSSEPNFQNLPTRDPVRGELVRRAFIPRGKNRCLVEVDFKGIEVCVAACYNHDPVLINYIKDPSTDMHRDTAMQLFGLTREQVDRKTTRDWSKNRFVFPQFYGSVYFQCAPHLWEAASQTKFKIPGSEVSIKKHLRRQGITELGDCKPGESPREGTFEYRVKEVETDFWQNRFKVYTEWKQRWWDAYLKAGEFITLTGFRIGPIGKKGMLARNDALNYPIQGSAFHCLLWTLIRLQRWIEKYKLETRIVGQIHDSVIADVPEDELQDYLDTATDLISRLLPKAWKWINVPMNAEAEVCPPGESWFTKKGWVRKEGVWGPER